MKKKGYKVIEEKIRVTVSELEKLQQKNIEGYSDMRKAELLKPRGDFMTELEKLKQLIDEENYPYFDDETAGTN